MTEIITLFEQSHMSVKDFAYAIGETKSRLQSWLRNEHDAPPVAVAKAHQLLADLEFWEAFFEAHPDLKCSYKVFKYLLDTPKAVS